MRYLKNIINNIKWFVCNDLRTMERVMDYDIDITRTRINELEKIINENYQTLLNKTIDNKNSINQRLVNINNEIQALKDIRVLDNKMFNKRVVRKEL